MEKYQKGCFLIKNNGKKSKITNHKKNEKLEIAKELYVSKDEFIEKNVLNLLKKNNSSGK